VPGFVKMDTWVGRRAEVHCTSVGKALVAYRSEAEIAGILREHGLRAHTSRTITRQADFRRELGRVRTRGYATDDEENSIGVRCVAAPVFNAEGEVEASIGVTATTSQLRRENVPRVAQLVMEAARKISIQVGYVRTIRPRPPGMPPARESHPPGRPTR
jgi:DNA-binding IclR family transcriptional regulator